MEGLFSQPGGEGFRVLVETVVQALIERQADEHFNGPWNAKGIERPNGYRNGFRSRGFQTVAGALWKASLANDPLASKLLTQGSIILTLATLDLSVTQAKHGSASGPIAPTRTSKPRSTRSASSTASRRQGPLCCPWTRRPASRR